jgi:hypothetical protein
VQSSGNCRGRLMPCRKGPSSRRDPVVVCECVGGPLSGWLAFHVKHRIALFYLGPLVSRETWEEANRLWLASCVTPMRISTVDPGSSWVLPVHTQGRTCETVSRTVSKRKKSRLHPFFGPAKGGTHANPATSAPYAEEGRDPRTL